MLRGRTSECARIDELLSGARAGRGGSLVLAGEPGIGKTALLDYAESTGPGLLVLRACGVEDEMELPYAALQQLLSRSLDRLDRLPVPQADALGEALGQRSVGGSDRFLVGLGALGLLSELAGGDALLCLVDDAQWIDGPSLSVLSFVARRVEVDAVVLLFATRENLTALDGLSEITLGGLPSADARGLLASVVPGRLDDAVRDRIVAETRGNPLALLELPHGLQQRELAGGFGLPDPAALSDRIEAGFLRRVKTLPSATQRLLLLAASEPLGDPALLWRASRTFGVGIEDAAPAEVEGLFQIGARAIFRHPLVRSAVYRAATTEDRHGAHRALAEATDVVTDQDRRAWHLAQATFGSDEELAGELEQSAGRAEARGGPAAAAAFLERAASLSSDPQHQIVRTLASAEFHYEAGAADRAAGLLDALEGNSLDDTNRARLERLRARVLLTKEHAHAAPRLLLDAARRLELLDPDGARSAYADAFAAAMIIGPGNLGSLWIELAHATESCQLLAARERPIDELLLGIARQAIDGYAAGVPLLRGALDRLVEEDTPANGQGALLWLACRVAMNLWDDESWFHLVDRLVRSVRGGGKLADLSAALSSSSSLTLLSGEFAAASRLVEEAEVLAVMTGAIPSVHGSMALAAWRGIEPSVEVTASSAKPRIAAGDHGTRAVMTHYTSALRWNSLGRYGDALEAAKLAHADVADLGYALWALPELIEAATRQGERALAASALELLRESTRPSGTGWARGIEARSAALVDETKAAEALYLEAISSLEKTRMRTHLARAHLVFGEWLRRENRRVDAREQFRVALEMFDAMGAGGFLRRAERELAATGERARQRSFETRSQLTPQETQIARLASEGYSNSDIAAQLYISARTVEYHLHKIYIQLGINSRNQIHRVLARDGTAS